MKTFLKNLGGFLLFAAILFYIGYQIYNSLYEPYETQTAVVYEQKDTVTVSGIAVREEELLSADTGGTLLYIYSDGSKVSSGSVVAQVYKDNESAEEKLELDKYKDKAGMLENAQQSLNTTGVSDASGTAIRSRLSELGKAIYSGDMSDWQSLSDNLLLTFCRRDVALGKTEGFEERINAVSEAIAELEATVKEPLGEVYSPKTGYFVSSTDGFESQLNEEKALSMTKESLESYLEKEDREVPGTIGKLINSVKWYYCAEVNAETAARLREGNTYTLWFSFGKTEEVKAKLEKLNTSPDGTVAVFSCDYLSENLSSMRMHEAQIVLTSFTGLRISGDALRYDDEQTGVYVQIGRTVRFRKVEVIYKGDNYYIVRRPELNETGVLRAFDQVIVSGKNLSAFLKDDD